VFQGGSRSYDQNWNKQSGYSQQQRSWGGQQQQRTWGTQQQQQQGTWGAQQQGTWAQPQQGAYQSGYQVVMSVHIRKLYFMITDMIY